MRLFLQRSEAEATFCMHIVSTMVVCGAVHGSQTPQRQPTAEGDDLCVESTPPKNTKLGMNGCAAKYEEGSMWDALRHAWTRRDGRLPNKEHKAGLGYEGFLSSRKDAGEWVRASEV